MKREGLVKIRKSAELTKGEKDYILDCQYHMAGGFHHALYRAIGQADESNLEKLSMGFPDEVQGFLAWTRGDLYKRASRIAGGDVGYIEGEKEASNG